MDLSRKVQVKLAPLNGEVLLRVKHTKDTNRLKGGCTNLMYACQQGLTDTIVQEVRLQVNTNREPVHTLMAQIFICQLQLLQAFIKFECANNFSVQSRSRLSRVWVEESEICRLNATATRENLLTNELSRITSTNKKQNKSDWMFNGTKETMVGVMEESMRDEFNIAL